MDGGHSYGRLYQLSVRFVTSHAENLIAKFRRLLQKTKKLDLMQSAASVWKASGNMTPT